MTGAYKPTALVTQSLITAVIVLTTSAGEVEAAGRRSKCHPNYFRQSCRRAYCYTKSTPTICYRNEMSCHCGYSKPDAIHIEPALAAEPTVVDEVNAPKTQEPPPVTSTPREVTALDPKKGKKSRATGGYLGAVGGARFYAEHQLIFRNVTHALNLHWAANGEYPKTHEEFMEKIINFNQIQLPELDPGVEYIYDPEDHTLKIHKPGDEPRSEDSSDP